MQAQSQTGPFVVSVGGLTRAGLVAALRKAGVQLNASAETLLEDIAFDQAIVEDVRIVERSVSDLGFSEGATLSEMFGAVAAHGLHLCPPTTGPYLRLSMLGQQSAPDAVMSNGRAPTGSITVASSPLREDDGYPKGFYLRVVNGVRWLRGYRCTDDYIWSAADRFAFRWDRPE